MTPCKKCHLEYTRKHYQNNKQYYIDKANRRDMEYKKTLHELLQKYLSEHPCVDCGISDPRVLEFDHVSGEKKHNIGDMKRLRFSWSSILTEIEKCEVRCANCHRIRTSVQFGWFEYDKAL